MKQRARMRIKPETKKVERVCLLSTSRAGETLDEFKERMTNNKSTINSKPLELSGEYERKYIPQFGEERWVTKLLEKHYA